MSKFDSWSQKRSTNLFKILEVNNNCDEIIEIYGNAFLGLIP